MRVLLVSCYELGHQPLGVAGPAARLRAAGHEVRALDLSVDAWDPSQLDWAQRVACSVPMHTATRLARQVIDEVRRRRPEVLVACYGLYGSAMVETADRALAGETDEALLAWVDGDEGDQVVHLGHELAQPPGLRPVEGHGGDETAAHRPDGTGDSVHR